MFSTEVVAVFFTLGSSGVEEEWLEDVGAGVEVFLDSLGGAVGNEDDADFFSFSDDGEFF